MGVEVGLRTIRQGLNYKKIFMEQNSAEKMVINNFILHKILPKMTFDASKKIIVAGQEQEKIDVLKNFMHELKKYINEDLITHSTHNAIKELEHIIKNSDNNNKIVNYWA